MKSIEVTYRCDYCKEVIDPDKEAVMAMLPGRIGYQDSFIPEDEEKIRHYHSDCLEQILTLERPAEIPEAEEEETETEPEAEPEEEEPNKPTYNPHADAYYGPFTPGVKNLPGLAALLDAGWTQTKCAQEFSVSPSTIYVWKAEINNMKTAGTWDEYCEERRSKK